MAIIWIFTADGFFSVVQYKAAKDPNKKGGHYQLAMDNPTVDYVLVRARIKADLEQVEANSSLDLHIQTDPQADYAHRALLSKTDWAAYLVESVMDIDYDSHFKEVVRDRSPKVEGRYNAMMSVWSAFAKLQDLRPYGGFTYGSSTTHGDDDWQYSSAYLGRGNSSSTTGGGYPWDRGKSTSTPAKTTTTTSAKPGYQEELTLSDTFVGLGQMAQLLTQYLPKDVPQAELDNSDDDAFALWLNADDNVGDNTVILDKSSVEELAEELGYELNWEE